VSLRDLNEGSPNEPVIADLCVIGSGPAGLTVARAAAERGLSVVILEAGPRIAEVRTEPYSIEFPRRTYTGATLGRAFGLGGTSVLWGGQLLPMMREEMATRAGAPGPGWPILLDELTPHYDTLLDWLHIDRGPFEVSRSHPVGHPMTQLDWTGLSPRLSKWIPFRRRNLAQAWMKGILSTHRVACWYNATVTGFETHGEHADAQISAVLGRSFTGQPLRVHCKHVVICAGALESARLVQDLLHQTGTAAGSDGTIAGCFLQDHLSLRIARVTPLKRRALAMLFAPVFQGVTMQSPRLHLSPALAQERGLPAAYAHIVAESPADSGFAALRDTLRNLQARRILAACSSGLRLLRCSPEIFEIVWWRAVHRRLASPRNAKLYLNLDFEQPQLRANRVLSRKTHTRSTGSEMIVDWDLGCDPDAIVLTIREQLESFWKRNDLARLARLEFLELSEIRSRWPNNLYEIYHPAGTTRMAADVRDGVVDPSLRVYGTANCYVVSSSVFPSMGAANPTFTVMALGLRLIAYLTRSLAP
jgi:choline dehydrogenase-like flavoprotein